MQIQKGDTIIYTDKLPNWDWIKNKISSQDTLGKFWKQSIVLTKSEKESLLEQINMNEQYTWKDSLFKNSIRIDFDSTWVYIKQAEKRHYAIYKAALQNKDTMTIKHFQKKWTYVYTFSKPLYIRNNSVALIGFNRMCGSTCGNDEVAFYRKENGNWIRWIIISRGDF